MEDKLKTLRAALRPDEVEWRIQSNKAGVAKMLTYKTARTDLNRLNESGLRWQKKYEEIQGKLFCGIGILNEDTGEWEWRWDTGNQTAIEANKGHASDAFKRAGFCWGIGLELYDFPIICLRTNKKIFPEKWFWKWKLNEAGKLSELYAAIKPEGAAKKKPIFYITGLDEFEGREYYVSEEDIKRAADLAKPKSLVGEAELEKAKLIANIKSCQNETTLAFFVEHTLPKGAINDREIEKAIIEKQLSFTK